MIMAQVDYFLKIDGIPGESKDSKHPDEIDVYSWAFGGAQAGSFGVGGGGGSGKVHMQDFSFTKKLDKATSELFLNMCNGCHIPKGVLTCRKAGKEPLEYLKITMQDLLVSSFSTGGSGGDLFPTENWSLNFTKVKYEYTEQDEKGKGKSPVATGWDTKKNEKLG
jgi:type VI secretion system secreted protein Hcp